VLVILPESTSLGQAEHLDHKTLQEVYSDSRAHLQTRPPEPEDNGAVARAGDVEVVRFTLATLDMLSIATGGVALGSKWCQVFVLHACPWPRPTGEAVRGGDGQEDKAAVEVSEPPEATVKEPPTDKGSSCRLLIPGPPNDVTGKPLPLPPLDKPPQGTTRCCDCARGCFNCAALGVMVRGGDARAGATPTTAALHGDLAFGVALVKLPLT